MAGLKALLSRNRLFHTFINLEGNARACVYTEPLWGLPTALYLPLVAKYMQELGLSSLQIGVVASVALLSQMVFSLLGGLITDKLGRRWTTTIFDILAWPVPLIIWMNAQGFAWFLAAAFFNGMFRITENSWGLLMVEDAPPSLLLNIYALVNVAGLLAGFVTPLTTLFVKNFSLITTMRWLYLFAALSIGLKIVLLHFMSTETAQGQIKKDELHGRPFQQAFSGSLLVLKSMFKKQPLMLVLGLMSCIMVVRSAMDNFWPLLITSRLAVDKEALPLLSGLRSLVMLVCFFVLAPRIKPQKFLKPMRLGLILVALINLMLFVLPRGLEAMVIVGVMAEALAFSLLIPLFSSLQMLLLDKAEKARMFGFSLSFCLLMTAPFGTINGFLSNLDPGLPMLLSFFLTLLAMFLMHLLQISLQTTRIDEA